MSAIGICHIVTYLGQRKNPPAHNAFGGLIQRNVEDIAQSPMWGIRVAERAAASKIDVAFSSRPPALFGTLPARKISSQNEKFSANLYNGDAILFRNPPKMTK